MRAIEHKVKAIMAYDSVATDTGRGRLRLYLHDRGLESLLKVLPEDYTEALQYLTKLFTTRGTE